jgi:hypothetical protein
VIGTLVYLGQEALAGPPLLCHPIEIEGARSLPWGGGKSWQSMDTSYDKARLADDTVALLDGGLPVLARMETLRRATVYAMKDHKIAEALHARLRERAGRAKGESAALALFDLGYIEEVFKQTKHVSKWRESLTSFDGYSSVVRAIAMRGGDAEMEFAAALISIHPHRSALEEHLRKAVKGAVPGSLLARNIISHFNDRGKTIAELQSALRAKKD